MSSPEPPAPPVGDDAASGSTADPAEEEQPPVDDPRQTVLDALSAELGDAIVGTHLQRDDLWVRVRADSWRRTAEVCRSLGFDYFSFLSGLDWMPHTWPNPKVEGASSEAGTTDDADDGTGAAAENDGERDEATTSDDIQDDTGADGWKTGYAGGDTRFQVFARLYSTSRHLGVTLKADLDEDNPTVETWSPLYAGADWHERETWEMYGFRFTGHPNLTHIYLPGEFEGFPLRKDYGLLSRELKPWPGLVDVEPMPGEGESADAEVAETGADGG